VSDGGLGPALVEAALWRGVGTRVALDGDPFAGLFGESTARAVVTCTDASLDRLMTLAGDTGLPVTRLGRTGGDALVVDGLFTVDLADLGAAHEGGLPALFG
jgi:phosphoribosylformylglycinamidine synthase